MNTSTFFKVNGLNFCKPTHCIAHAKEFGFGLRNITIQHRDKNTGQCIGLITFDRDRNRVFFAVRHDTGGGVVQVFGHSTSSKETFNIACEATSSPLD